MRSMMVTAFVVMLAATLPPARPAAAEDVDVKALYEKKCKVCHSLGGEAGKMAEKGGPLDGVGSKRDAEWLRAYLLDPKSKIEDAKMPALKYTEQELDALVDYMLSLK